MRVIPLPRLILASLLALFLTACGGGGDDPDAECIEFVGPLQPGQAVPPPYCPG